MATNEGIMVRCSPELLEAMDRLRGERSRPEFIRRAIERVIQGEAIKQQATDLIDPAQIAERAITRQPFETRYMAGAGRTPPDHEIIRPSECVHPPNQRIGNVCMICDTKVGR